MQSDLGKTKSQLIPEDLASALLLNDIEKKRVRRIELLSLAWKAKVLPLNYTRIRDCI